MADRQEDDLGLEGIFDNGQPPSDYATGIAITKLASAVRYLGQRTARLETVLWCVIGTMAVAIGAALIKLVVKP